MFGDTDKAREELRKFLHNYSCIGRLASGVRTAIDGEASKLAALQRLVDDFNAGMRGMVAAGALFCGGGGSSLARLLTKSGLPLDNAKQLETLLRDTRGVKADKPELLYRGSVHGWTDVDYKDRCAGKPNHLVVIQAVDGGYLFGGFSSVGLPVGARTAASDTTIHDTSAFLFTLTNPHGIPPTAYKLKAGATSCMRLSAGYGPMFGAPSSDVYLNSPFNTSTGSACFLRYAFAGQCLHSFCGPPPPHLALSLLHPTRALAGLSVCLQTLPGRETPPSPARTTSRLTRCGLSASEASVCERSTALNGHRPAAQTAVAVPRARADHNRRTRLDDLATAHGRGCCSRLLGVRLLACLPQPPYLFIGLNEFSARNSVTKSKLLHALAFSLRYSLLTGPPVRPAAWRAPPAAARRRGRGSCPAAASDAPPPARHCRTPPQRCWGGTG